MPCRPFSAAPLCAALLACRTEQSVVRLTTLPSFSLPSKLPTPQALAFLTPVAADRRAPKGWWCAPPPTGAQVAEAVAAGATPPAWFGAPYVELPPLPKAPKAPKRRPAAQLVLKRREVVTERLYPPGAGVARVAPPLPPAAAATDCGAGASSSSSGGVHVAAPPPAGALPRRPAVVAFLDSLPAVHRSVIIEEYEELVIPEGDAGDASGSDDERGRTGGRRPPPARIGFLPAELPDLPVVPPEVAAMVPSLAPAFDVQLALPQHASGGFMLPIEYAMNRTPRWVGLQGYAWPIV